MSNFHQDPWRPGAAVPLTSAAPEDPPEGSETEQLASPTETPVAPAEPTETPAPVGDTQAVQDELEKALAEMRGQK